jgi:hypothetical protein
VKTGDEKTLVVAIRAGRGNAAESSLDRRKEEEKALAVAVRAGRGNAAESGLRAA